MKLYIGVCNSQEFVPADFFWSWENMVKPYNYVMVRFDHSDDVIRNNQMINRFLKSDCDIMVKMDVDQVYPPHYFEFLVPYTEQYKVIGPKIHNKWRSRGYVPLLFDTNNFPLMATPNLTLSGISEVAYPHTNLFYAREVLEKVAPPWYEAHHDEKGLKRTADVDCTFLDKIKAAGYKLYIDTTVEVTHLVLEGVDTKLHNRWHRL
jgi:hypothetical protein